MIFMLDMSNKACDMAAGDLTIVAGHIGDRGDK